MRDDVQPGPACGHERLQSVAPFYSRWGEDRKPNPQHSRPLIKPARTVAFAACGPREQAENMIVLFTDFRVARPIPQGSNLGLQPPQILWLQPGCIIDADRDA